MVTFNHTRYPESLPVDHRPRRRHEKEDLAALLNELAATPFAQSTQGQAVVGRYDEAVRNISGWLNDWTERVENARTLLIRLGPPGPQGLTVDQRSVRVTIDDLNVENEQLAESINQTRTQIQDTLESIQRQNNL